MSALSEARDQLTTALRDRFAGTPIAERVHRVTPDRVDPPCVFLGGSSLTALTIGTPGVRAIIVTLPVYLVASGQPSAQTAQLDEMTARAWDAALSIGADPSDARPTSIDVGGPNLRGAVVQVDMTVRALSLCTPTLQEAATHG